jgi:tetratricopeptide (TPR) repeat protein
MRRWPNIFGLIFGIFLSSLVSQVALANYGEPYDYYVPAPDRLLENVEKYHLNLGISKVKAKQYKEAWPEFGFMLHYFPNHPKALQHMSELSVLLGNETEAIKYFDQAVKLYPTHAATYGLWGTFLHRTGKINEAIDKYQQALKMDPNQPEMSYNLGLAYFSQKNYKKANQLAQKAYEQGYPLQGLKKQLQKNGAWKTAKSSQQNGNG